MTINFNDITDTATPTSGTFNTGGNSNVKGAGQNFLTYSSVLTNGIWVNNQTTTTGSQSDPFGGTTALLINNGTANNYHYVSNNISLAPQTYTLSAYVKAGTINYVGIAIYSTAFYGVIFNLTTGAFSANITNAPISYSSSNVGNGWWRISIAVSTTVNNNFYNILLSEDGTNIFYTGTSKTVYLAAPQIEIGSTANTYVPTTTAAIYNTPQLTFSGVASIGLQSDGALYVQPAGTGAIQAQATTSSATGGNARGVNAVDFSTLRASASSVASGAYSTISGGYNNTANGFASNVSGAYGSTASNFTSSVCGGQFNLASGQAGFVGSGYGNTAGGYNSFVGSGYTNSALGNYNFVGGGFTNSGTSASAVTTQSATMNGTTAVTLSGSNASIKVGQFISGTSIANNTYVTAISGTSLTLSTAATGSSTSTLSFYTPHGVVVGGGNNTATGSYSFIGGGGDAGTAANRNVASGAWSVVAGGIKNTASGNGSFVGGGGYYGGASSPVANTANGDASVIVGGGNNQASGFISSIVGGFSNSATSTGTFVGSGYYNTASGSYSAAIGGYAGTTRLITGNVIMTASLIPISGTTGAQQTGLLVLGRETTNATPTVLCSDANAASSTNQVILPNNSAYYFRGEIVSGVTGGGNTKGWFIEGVIKRGANAAATSLVGTPTVMSSYADVGAATWTIAVTADTTNGGLAVTFTGQASTTIRTVAQIRTTEMTY